VDALEKSSLLVLQHNSSVLQPTEVYPHHKLHAYKIQINLKFLHDILKVNVHCKLLYDHVVGPLFMHNLILKKSFNLTNYKCLFSKLKNIKLNNKHQLFCNRVGSYPQFSHKVQHALNVMFPGLLGWADQ
jgi:hypothetical protein